MLLSGDGNATGIDSARGMDAKQDVYPTRFQINLFQKFILSYIEKRNVSSAIERTESVFDPIEMFQRGSLANLSDNNPNAAAVSRDKAPAPLKDSARITT